MGSTSVRNVVGRRYSPLPLHSSKNTFCSLCEKCQKLVVILLLKLSNVLHQIAFKVPQTFKGSPSYSRGPTPLRPHGGVPKQCSAPPLPKRGEQKPFGPFGATFAFLPFGIQPKGLLEELKV